MSTVWIALAAFTISVWALAQIWFAQLVIYPLFSRVGTREYRSYHAFYSGRIPLPVIIPGVACFLSPLVLAAAGPPVPLALTGLNVALGAIGAGVTLALEVPRHASLVREGKDENKIAELVKFNWPRTGSISLQAVMNLWILTHAWDAMP